ncbi:unnamed protein product [Urochloa humidicola]
MGRAPCCDKARVKKGPWSPEEDTKLKAYIEEHGTSGNWISLPQKIGLKRCGKSCRLRWLNYLRPNIKHSNFTEEEEHIICSLYISIGSRWSIIAAQLPGRTDNGIKNYWNTKLKKKLLGKRAPSRRAREDSYLTAGGGNMCTTSGVNNSSSAATATQTLSASALERIQHHMGLQGLYSAFGCANNDNAAAATQWPMLEALLWTNRLLPTDAVATTVGVQQPQHLVDRSLVAGASAAVKDESIAGANYMAPGSFEWPKLGSEAASAEMSSVQLDGGYGAGFGSHHHKLYDFPYSNAGSVGGLAQGGHIPPLPDPFVGADEFSTWTASCDYGAAGQLQGNSISIVQDHVLSSYGQQ